MKNLTKVRFFFYFQKVKFKLSIYYRLEVKMRKILFINLFILMLVCINPKSYAYSTFEYTEKVNYGKYLSEFTEDDYDRYYDKIAERRFYGWNYYIVNDELKIKFIGETMYRYYNNGKSPIIYNYKSAKKTIDEYTLKSTGGIKVQTQKTTKIFGDGLQASLNYEFKTDHSVETNETVEVKVSVEPGTQLKVY